MTRSAQPDWSARRYETFAAELAPAAERLVELAAPAAGDRVLDLATGTGNAALAAARHGASVTGVDSAARLLEVARSRAAAEGLELEFVSGDLLDPPLPAGSCDLALSSFGVIFTSDPERAIDAIARALRPGGRALLTAWVPRGPIDADLAVFAQAVAQATGRAGAGALSLARAGRGGRPRRGVRRRGAGATTSSCGSPPPRRQEYLELGERDHPLSPARRETLATGGHLRRHLRARARGAPAMRTRTPRASACTAPTA